MQTAGDNAQAALRNTPLLHKTDASAAEARRPSHELSRTRVKTSDLILFTTQLSIMLDSGVILSDALDAISVQAPDPRFKEIILDMSDRVKSGEPFSKVLSNYPHVFNAMFTSMVKASEASGKMVQMLCIEVQGRTIKLLDREAIESLASGAKLPN